MAVDKRRTAKLKTAKLRAACVAGLAAWLLAAGMAPPAAAQGLPAPLLQADELARSRPAAAIGVLEQYAVEPEALAVPVRRALLVRLRRLHVDLGDYRAAAGLSARLRELGHGQRDPASIAYAALTDIDEHLRAYRPDAAKAELDKLASQITLDTLPDLAFSVHMLHGRLHLLKAEYERAIERFQAGIALAGRTEHPAGARVEAMINLAYTHTNLHDAAGAYRIVEEALAADDGRLRARTRSLLHLTRAFSLADTQRLDEAEQAFARARAIARDAAVAALEGRVLADWADLALRRERYPQAERLARDALRIAEARADAGTAITARANIGFALGGQGKMAEALPYIDGVIAHFRQQDNGQALLAMLDEKGRLLQRHGWLQETVAVLREQQKLEREQFTEQRGKAVAALQDRFERAESARRIELLKEQNRLKDATIRSRGLAQVALALAALLALAVGLLVGLLYRRARKSNAQLQALNTRLAEQSVRDPLTGLYNRRSFVEKMAARAARVEQEQERRGQAGDTFLVLDLDHFKSINDSWGHGAGDAVLVEVAKRLQAAVRDSDTVLRWGGEEFVIHSGASADQGEALARRVLDAVGGAPIEVGSASLHVTVSAGMVELPFAGLPGDACDWQRALQLADAALYQAKHGGRDRCCRVLPGTRPLTWSVAQLEHDLGGGAAAGQVSLQIIARGAS